jgi:NADH:ubiquinone oxidoreductase subunit F (NADH-binding)
MTIVHRVLYPHPIADLDEYLARGGGQGLEAARKVEPAVLIDEVEASGLRGRGDAGFPTGTKWRTVAGNASEELLTTVVVNGAEGEPGTFKDRTILRNNPFQVVEGALIAARAVGAATVIFALKESFATEVGRLRQAIEEIAAAGWSEGMELEIFEGPNEYLYGEETALLETIDGRYPFPRIAPPFRRGVDEVVEGAGDVGEIVDRPLQERAVHAAADRGRGLQHGHRRPGEQVHPGREHALDGRRDALERRGGRDPPAVGVVHERADLAQ